MQRFHTGNQWARLRDIRSSANYLKSMVVTVKYVLKMKTATFWHVSSDKTLTIPYVVGVAYVIHISCCLYLVVSCSILDVLCSQYFT